jgi:tetratricopeptide (TPR) repeat protein
MTRRLYISTILILISLTLASQGTYELVLMSRSLVMRGRAGEAVSLISGSIAGNSDSRLYVIRGDANLILGDIAAAISDYQSANKLIQSSGDFGLAKAYASRRDIKNSLFYLERNLSSPYKKSEKEIMLDKSFAAIENTPEWRLFWKTERYTFPEQKLSEIEFSVSRGSISDAEAVMKDLSESYPADKNTIYARALIDYSRQKYTESINELTALLASDKDNPRFLLLLASAQMAASNMAGASGTYSRLIEAEYPDASVFLKRAECYRKTQEYDKALKDADRYLSYYPENSEAMSLSGRIAMEKGDNLKAIELYSRNISLHPGDPQCYIDRANSYFVSRTWDNAVRDYSMALDFKPGDPEVWLNKGIALLNAGNTVDACHDFRKALELGNKKASGYISRSCIK